MLRGFRIRRPARKPAAATAGLFAAVLALVACGAPPPPPPPSPDAEAAALIAPLGESDAMALRAALMRAHLTAAMALAGEGDAAGAGAQFRLPVRAVYEPDRAVFEARRDTIDTAKFELAALRAELGVGAGDLAPLTDDLERQIARFAPRDFDRPRVIGALLTHLAAEYAGGVEGHTVINPLRYHNAYGVARETMALVAQALRSGAISGEGVRNQLMRETEALAYIFPGAAAPQRPAAPGEVQAQITRVKLALPAPR